MITRKRKNPHVGPIYLSRLSFAILYGDPEELSFAINNYNVGNECKDCDEYYTDCICEGDVNGGKCKECKQNRCICDFDIWKGNKINDEKVRREAWRIAKKTLNDSDLERLFNHYILSNLNYNLTESSIVLSEFNELTGRRNKASFLREFEV